MRLSCSAASLVLMTTALLPGQDPRDLIAVTFGGEAFTLSSRFGSAGSLGATGSTGSNGMARLGDLIYATEQVGTGPTAQRFLATIDDATGVATRSVALTRDLRALAPGAAGELLAIAERTGNDELVRVRVSNGAIAVVGSTGFASIQGLTAANGVLYGWDLAAGLLRIDPSTGAATDVSPSAVGTGTVIQFLTTMSDGRVVGGQGALFELDLATGIPTLRGNGFAADLRGAEERFGVSFQFGRSCGNLRIALTGDSRPGGSIATSSTGHPRLGAGFAMIGFSDSSFQGLRLPFLIDALLGTVGCFLNVSPDVAVPLTADATGTMRLLLSIPELTEGLIFHVQHMTLGDATRPMAFSNGGTVRVAL